MFVSADTMAFIIGLGLPAETLVELFKRLDEDAKAVQPPRVVDDTAERRRAWDRDRKRRNRVSGGSPVECPAEMSADPFLPPPSPEPPTTTNLSEVPPYNPPEKPKRKRKPRAAVTAEIASVAEQIWALQPVLSGKRRATRPDVEQAVDAAAERGGDLAEIVACCRAYYALPASRKDGGEFAMGAQRLLERDRWREFKPGAPTIRAVPEGPATPELQARRLRHYRDTGEWKDGWGPQPTPTDRSAVA